MRQLFKIFLLAALGNLVFLADARAIPNGNLNIEIRELKNQKGQICLAIYSGGRGFPSNDKFSVRAQCVKIKETQQKVTFSDLKAGTYAVSVFHDANQDGKLNSNAFGIPVEGFGFSNNPTVITKPPKFIESAIFVAGSNTNIQIQLQYPCGG